MSEYLSPNPALANLLDSLPYPKFIFTNSPRKYADNVLAQLGLAECFEKVFALNELEPDPKPSLSSFGSVIHDINYEARQLIFFDDNEQNLRTAKSLGLSTIFIGKTRPRTEFMDLLFPTVENALDILIREKILSIKS